MPIRSENKHRYPKEWPHMRKAVLERAQNKCEFCGVENHRFIVRDKLGYRYVSDYDLDAATLDGERLIKVILTVAHLDYNDLETRDLTRLRALCQMPQPLRCPISSKKPQSAKGATDALMIEETWCNCRITEPRIVQHGDDLVCTFCHKRKTLPPRVDLEWERLKRELLRYGQKYYGGFHKDVLIDMLINRDRQMLDYWKKLSRQGNSDYVNARTFREVVTNHVPYIVFKEKEKP